MAGLSRVGAGVGGVIGGVTQSALADPTQDTDNTGDAQLLVLTTTGDSIASTGDHVTFDTILVRHGFSGVPVEVGDAWTHPLTGVYVIDYEHAWDTFEGGGTVELELDGSVPADGTVGSGSSGQYGRATHLYYAEAGQVGRIKITHADASAQTCDVTLRVALPDPSAPTSDQWVKEFDADAWGIVKVGSSWWTTEGDSGLTVSERDLDGTELSSFEATEVDGPDTRVRGITHDGTDLWVMGDEEIVGRYTTAGVWQQSIDLDATWAEGTGMGVAFDGADLWLVGDNTDQLRRYSTAGAHELTVSLPSGAVYCGATVYADQVYVVDQTNQQLLVYDLDGTSAGTVDISNAVDGPTGVWISDAGTLYISKDGDGVYRRLKPLGAT